MHVRIHVCMCACVNVHMYVCICTYICIYICECMYVHMYVCMYVYGHLYSALQETHEGAKRDYPTYVSMHVYPPLLSKCTFFSYVTWFPIFMSFYNKIIICKRIQFYTDKK